MAGLPRPGGLPSTRTLPRASGTCPSRTRSSVDLPVPLGPISPTNSPGPSSRLAPDQMLRCPNTTAASSKATTGADGLSGALSVTPPRATTEVLTQTRSDTVDETISRPHIISVLRRRVNWPRLQFALDARQTSVDSAHQRIDLLSADHQGRCHQRMVTQLPVGAALARV